MVSYRVVYKGVGETPLEALEKYRVSAGIKKDVPLAYAGRLDPMAEGLMLVLIGEECKKQKQYHGLDKEYEFEVLIGFSSDTGDVLGIAEPSIAQKQTFEEKVVGRVAEQLVGRVTFPYPTFSSKTVQGKPLHTWALEGKLKEIEVPIKTSHVYSLSYLGARTPTKEELRNAIFKKINSVSEVTDPKKALGADFRRAEIRARWDKLLKQTSREHFTILRFRCISSSGTYMRTLAEVIAKNLGENGLAFSIKRTAIGRHLQTPLGGWWYKRYT